MTLLDPQLANMSSGKDLNVFSAETLRETTLNVRLITTRETSKNLVLAFSRRPPLHIRPNKPRNQIRVLRQLRVIHRNNTIPRLNPPLESLPNRWIHPWHELAYHIAMRPNRNPMTLSNLPFLNRITYSTREIEEPMIWRTAGGFFKHVTHEREF